MQGDSSTDTLILQRHTGQIPHQPPKYPTTTAVSILTSVSASDKDNTALVVHCVGVIFFYKGTDQFCCQDNKDIRSLFGTA